MELLILMTIVSFVMYSLYLVLCYRHPHHSKALTKHQQIEILQNHVQSLQRNEQLLNEQLPKHPYGSHTYRHVQSQYYQNLKQQYQLNQQIKHLQIERKD